MTTVTPRRVFVEIPFYSTRKSASHPLTQHIPSPLKRKVEVVITNENTVKAAHPVHAAKKARHDSLTAKPGATDASNNAKKRRSRPLKRVLSAPCPHWTPIYGANSKEAIEDRIQMREFCHRFSSTLGLAKMHVDALDNFDAFPEQTCRAILTSLIKLISRDESDRDARTTLLNSLKSIKSQQVNLDGVALAIESLRSVLSSNLNVPNPASAETVEITRFTRRGGQTVIEPSQLIPVILSLIEEVVKTRFIRQGFDDGMQESVQVNKNKVAALKAITEPWVTIRKELREKIKRAPKQGQKILTAELTAVREKHRADLHRLRVQHATQLHACRLRYQPLGADLSGRVYYALSHPVYLGNRSKNSSLLPSQRDRNALKNWAYFIFVWGRKPDEAPPGAEGDDEVDETEQWWAFSDPATIRQLATWLLRTSTPSDTASSTAVSAKVTPRESLVSQQEFDDDDDASEVRDIPPQIRDLSKGLNEFADFLDVRFPPEEKKQSAASDEAGGENLTV